MFGGLRKLFGKTNDVSQTKPRSFLPGPHGVTVYDTDQSDAQSRIYVALMTRRGLEVRRTSRGTPETGMTYYYSFFDANGNCLPIDSKVWKWAGYISNRGQRAQRWSTPLAA